MARCGHHNLTGPPEAHGCCSLCIHEIRCASFDAARGRWHLQGSAPSRCGSPPPWTRALLSVAGHRFRRWRTRGEDGQAGSIHHPIIHQSSIINHQSSIIHHPLVNQMTHHTRGSICPLPEAGYCALIGRCRPSGHLASSVVWLAESLKKVSPMVLKVVPRLTV